MFQDFLFFNRPLSPHLSIYLPQQSSLFSIWHRLSGIMLLICLFSMLLFINFLNFCSYLNLFFKLNIVLSFIFLKISFCLILLILFYHMLNGIRFLFWNLSILLDKIYLIYFTYLTIFLFLAVLFWI